MSQADFVIDAGNASRRSFGQRGRTSNKGRVSGRSYDDQGECVPLDVGLEKEQDESEKV